MDMTFTTAPHRWRRFAVISVLLTLVVGEFGMMRGASADVIPQNKVTIRMEGFNLSGSYSTPGGQPTGVGQFKNGNAGEYPEGACVPALISATNKDKAAGDIAITPYFDYAQSSQYGVISLSSLTTALTDPSAQADNLNDLTFPGADLSSVTSFQTDGGTPVSATIAGPYSGDSGTAAPTPTDVTRHYNILLNSVPKNVTVYVLMCAQLHVDASEYGGGAQMSIRTGEGGAENVAIQASKLLVLPQLTLTKQVVGGTATADQFTFHISPAINGQADFPIVSGQDSVVIDNIEPDGVYHITETGPADYAFQSGSGTGCSFDGSTASTTLVAAKPQMMASCTFVNAYVAPAQPKLTVTKVVINDDGGTAVVSDFPLSVGTTQVTSGVEQEFAAGTYTVSETGSTSYLASYSGDCDANGQITLNDGDVKSCTIINNDVAGDPTWQATTGTLTVIKTVVNDDGGTAVASDFNLTVTGNSPSPSSFAGDANGTTVVIDSGEYSVDEQNPGNYAVSYSAGCAGLMPAGGSAVCTVTNNDPAATWQATTGTLIVVKHVINDGNGNRSASDFTLDISGVNPSSASVTGSENGVAVTLDAGAYEVTESNHGPYVVSYSADCVGTMVAGTTKTCTVTNDDRGGNGGGGWQATTGTLTIIKHVINDNGGSSVASDFTIDITGTNPSPTSVVGSENGTDVVLDAGSYSVTESNQGPYDVTYDSGCSGTMVAGGTATCTVTNNDTNGTGGWQATTGTLTVYKTVNNTYGGTAVPSDFTITVSGANPSLTSFPGSDSGTTVILDAGAFTVDEAQASGYQKSIGEGCSGTISAGQSVSCTIINSDIPREERVSADLKIDKTGDSATLPTGTTLDYLITLRNIGPDPATNAQVSDLLPAGFVYQSSSASKGAYAPGTGIWTIGSMAVDEVVTLHILVQVTAAPGTYTNTAVASALEYDPDHTNNTESHVVTVTVNNGGGNGNSVPGGSGSTSGGGGTPGPTPTPTPTPTPEPRVLGDTDTSSDPGTTPTPAVTPTPVVTPPEPRVLGATDELPRTGLPDWMMLFAAVMAGAVAKRVRE